MNFNGGDVIVKTAQLIGFEDFDDFTIEKVKEYVEPLLDRYRRIFGTETIKEFKIVVSAIHDGVGQDEYEVIGHLDTTYGLFKVTRSGWDILNVVNEIVENLVRQITEEKEKKIKAKRKLPANP